MGLEVVDDVGRLVHVPLDQGGVGLASEGEPADVGQGLLTGVADADLRHVVVARDPRHATGHPRRPADHVGLLEHEHLGPAVVRRDGGGQTGCSRAQDDDVDAAIPLRRVPVVLSPVHVGYLLEYRLVVRRPGDRR